MIWSNGIYNYHVVDEGTLYITATNRGLNFFTDGLSGHKEDPENSIEQGLVNDTIHALDKKSGVIKWKMDIDYPPRVSPLVSKGVVYTGYIKFGENDRTGIILALDKNTEENFGNMMFEAQSLRSEHLLGAECFLYLLTKLTFIQTKRKGKR